jgi:hypothetical protein
MKRYWIVFLLMVLVISCSCATYMNTPLKGELGDGFYEEELGLNTVYVGIVSGHEDNAHLNPVIDWLKRHPELKIIAITDITNSSAQTSGYIIVYEWRGK